MFSQTKPVIVNSYSLWQVPESLKLVPLLLLI